VISSSGLDTKHQRINSAFKRAGGLLSKKQRNQLNNEAIIDITSSATKVRPSTGRPMQPQANLLRASSGMMMSPDRDPAR
jgi:hypothetical protein